MTKKKALGKEVYPTASQDTVKPIVKKIQKSTSRTISKSEAAIAPKDGLSRSAASELDDIFAKAKPSAKVSTVEEVIFQLRDRFWKPGMYCSSLPIPGDKVLIQQVLQSSAKPSQASGKRKPKKDDAAVLKGNKDDIFGVGPSKSRR